MPYSEQDRAIFASLRHENEYWKSVGGHPPVNENYDAPRTYECAEQLCRERDMADDDGGEMMQCPDCDDWFCPNHRAEPTEALCAVCLRVRSL